MLELDSPSRLRPRAATCDRVFLLPGQWYFSQKAAIVKTLLGSCVAVTLWHPQRRMGGMCHFLLPSRVRAFHAELDGRFGDEAISLLLREIDKSGTRPADYEAHLYGGADTMPDHARVKFNIGERNVEKAFELIDQQGFQLMAVDVGGNEPRSVSLDLAGGLVDLRRGPPPGHGRAP